MPEEDPGKYDLSKSQVGGDCYGVSKWPWHLNGRNLVIYFIFLLVSWSNKNWNIGQTYGFLFHSQFLRLSETPFGDPIGLLLNWKIKEWLESGCKIQICIANYDVKDNYFLMMASQCDFRNPEF